MAESAVRFLQAAVEQITADAPSGISPVKAAMLARLQLVGPTAYARDYDATSTRGRHAGITVEDTAEADGAAFKLADELAERTAYRAMVASLVGLQISTEILASFGPPSAGRHRPEHFPF